MRQSDDPTFRGTIAADDLEKAKKALPLEPRPFQREVFDRVKEFEVPPILFPPRGFYGYDKGKKGGDYTAITKLNGRKFDHIIIDEYANFPDWKWYRNPFKWWWWRRLTRKWKRDSSFFEFRHTPKSKNKFWRGKK